MEQLATLETLSTTVFELKDTVNELKDTVNELKELSLHIVEHMATKDDLQREITAVRSEMATKTELAELRTELATKANTEDALRLHDDISNLKTEMRLGFQDLKEDIAQLDKRTIEDTDALAHDVVQLKSQLAGT